MDCRVKPGNDRRGPRVSPLQVVAARAVEGLELTRPFALADHEYRVMERMVEIRLHFIVVVVSDIRYGESR